jgi:peptidoglycan hydrolase-like protein with peptidoglycan-binding domain
MEPYVVRTGDHLALIGHRLGFDPDAVWNDPANAKLKALRGNPNILRCGDVLYVPTRQKVWLSVRLGTTNRFVATVPKTSLSLTFLQAGMPVSGASCVVHGLSPPNQFTTDANGKLTLTVPLTLQALVVEFPKVPLVRQVLIGHLDPITEPNGVLQRLRSLGHVSPRTIVDPSDAEAVGRVVRAFQRARGLALTGTVDDATRAALKQAHGC